MSSVLITHAIREVTQPNATPVTLAQVKAHLQIQHNLDDDDLQSKLWAATQHAERETNLWFLPRTLEIGLEYFGPVMWGDARLVAINRTFAGGVHLELPVWPVRSLTSIQYIDATGTEQTWPTNQYQFWIDHRPPLIAPAYGVTYPVTRPGQLRAVRVTVEAGYADANSVPYAAKEAVKLIVAHNYAGNKGDGKDPTGELGIPPGAVRLLKYLREDYYR